MGPIITLLVNVEKKRIKDCDVWKSLIPLQPNDNVESEGKDDG